MSTTTRTILSVSELTTAIKKYIETTFRGVVVEGEISNFKRQSSGHLYFSLKDANAQIQAVMFKASAETLERMPKDGDKVIVKGELSVYAPRGTTQIVVRALKFAGVGDLLMQLHERKEQLQKMGWFSPERKKQLPPHPRTIGVVTSPTGAVIQDIINVLTRRAKNFHLILNPVRVQGVGAAEEIAQAINEFNRYKLADVLIVGRGGGSLEDLWAFNEIVVAEAIYNSEIPVISAVGHETDTSIADFVADVRAPTPSAAAEIAVGEQAAKLDALERAKQQVKQILWHKLQQAKNSVRAAKMQPLIADPMRLLERYRQMVDVMESQIEQRSPIERIKRSKERLNALVAHLKSLDPKNLLQKGYAIVFREKDNCAILSKSDAPTGQRVRIQWHDASVGATIDDE